MVGTRALSFSSDGSLLATGSALGSTVVWAAHSGHVVKTFDDGGGSITSVAFSPDGSQLATGSDDDGVRVWGLHGEGRLFYFTGHVGPVTSVRFDPKGASVVSTSDDGTSRIFEVAGIEAGVSAAVLAGGSSAYLASAYVPGGARLVTGSADGTAPLGRATRATLGRCGSRARADRRSRIRKNLDRRGERWEAPSCPGRPNRRRLPQRRAGRLRRRSGRLGKRRVPGRHGSILRCREATGLTGEDSGGGGHSDGREVGAVAGARVLVWDAGSGRVLAGFAVRPGTTCLAISPNGEHGADRRKRGRGSSLVDGWHAARPPRQPSARGDVGSFRSVRNDGCDDLGRARQERHRVGPRAPSTRKRAHRPCRHRCRCIVQCGRTLDRHRGPGERGNLECGDGCEAVLSPGADGLADRRRVVARRLSRRGRVA